jgi:hypothetical protein
MKPSTKRALDLLLKKSWVSGNELFLVAGTRYGARLDELKEQGYRWDKRWIRGSRVPQYHLILPDEQLTLDQTA